MAITDTQAANLFTSQINPNDFYKDRILREDRSARNQWFNSDRFSADDKKYFNEGSKGQRLNRQDRFVEMIDDFALRNTPRYNFNTKKYDGPMERPGGYTNEERYLSDYVIGLNEFRYNQNQKNNPMYGMSAKDKAELIESHEPPTNWMGLTFQDDNEYNSDNVPSFGTALLDSGKELTRSALFDLGFMGDIASSIGGQLINPYDYEDERGNIYPRGFFDLMKHTNEIDTFHNEIGRQYTADEWEKLGFSEKKDIQDNFKKITGSNFAYDPSYSPILGSVMDGNLTNIASDIGNTYLQPSGDYEDLPFMESEFLGKIMGSDEPVTMDMLELAEVLGLVTTGGMGYGTRKGIKKAASTGILQNIKDKIPKIIKNHPYLASLLGLTGNLVTSEIIED